MSLKWKKNLRPKQDSNLCLLAYSVLVWRDIHYIIGGTMLDTWQLMDITPGQYTGRCGFESCLGQIFFYFRGISQMLPVSYFWYFVFHYLYMYVGFPMDYELKDPFSASAINT